jgi:hypothetical protein
MLRKKLLHVVTIFFLVVITATSCKKDLFNEKDAIAAQTDLLNLKYAKDADILKLKFSNDLILKNIDVQIKNIDLQIQRVSDSAQLAMLRLGTSLKFSADSAMERIKQANALAQILQSYQNQRMLAMQADSLARGTATFNAEIAKAKATFDDNIARAKKLYDDSVTLSATNKAAAAAAIASSKAILRSMTKDYVVRVYNNSNTVVPGAKVSVYTYGSTTLKTVTADNDGVARFVGVIIDPAAYVSVSAAGHAGYLFTTQTFNILEEVAITEGTETYKRTVLIRDAMVVDVVSEAANNAKILAPTNTIKGSILGDLDLTNGPDLEAISGTTVTFTANIITKINNVAVTGIFTFAGMSVAGTGLYSVNIPDGDWSVSIPATIEVEQKLFVNAWSDEDASKSVPSIRTTGATLKNTVGSNISAGSGKGYYFTLPADSLTKSTVVLENSFINPYSPTQTANEIFSGFVTYSNSYTSTSPRIDSLVTSSSFGISNLKLNNSALTNGNDKSVMWSIKKINDTLPVTFVSLVSGWVKTAPKLIATTQNGKLSIMRFEGKNVNNIYTANNGSGGLFNNSAMYKMGENNTWYDLSQNWYGINRTYLANLANEVESVNTTSVSTGNKTTIYLPIEYRTTISRTKKPI